MATVESTQQQVQAQQDRVRRRPFSSWMKKLANFKGSSSTHHDASHSTNGKRHTPQNKMNTKKQTPSKKNNPYPESGHLNSPPPNGQRASSPVQTGTSLSTSSFGRRRHSMRSSEDGNLSPTTGNKSAAPTVSTGIAHSDAAPSHAPSSAQETTGTVGAGTGRGVDSTFSSPAPSVRSLTTTLTTIHSAAAVPGPGQANVANAHNTQAIHFSHQFPTSPPPNALPAHLAPHASGGHPSTYNTATANNLLTDNASILTLASSSKRRRRRSMDTDASVRALAPSSLFGNSRESLPLSILSANIEASNQPRPSGVLNERASIYSTAGIAPQLPSDRNSYYAGKQSHTADGSSVKSGFLGHGRNDSISGSIGGIGASGSPLASPRDNVGHGAGVLSRSNSNWTAGDDLDDETETENENKDPKEKGNSKA